MDKLRSMPKEPAEVQKPDGEIVGPYQMIFAGDTIIVLDAAADVAEGDVLLRKLPNGRIERLTVTESIYYQSIGGLPSHYQLKYRKGRKDTMEKAQQTINIHSAQAVQIGDHNTQQITATIQMLVQKIESSDASESEKNEAKSRLQKFLEHPLVAAIVGATISLGG